MSDDSSDEFLDPLWGSKKQPQRGSIYLYGPGFHECYLITDQSHTLEEILDLAELHLFSFSDYTFYVLELDEISHYSEFSSLTPASPSTIVFWNQAVIISSNNKFWKYQALFPKNRKIFNYDLPYFSSDLIDNLFSQGAVWVEAWWSFTPTLPKTFHMDRFWWKNSIKK